MNIVKMPTIYIGYDPKEDIYYRALKASIEKHASRSYNIVPLVQKELRRAGLYWRGSEWNNGNQLDMFDEKPFSTQFSFTRFLVPFLQQSSGLALFMDCDMFVRSDITEVFDRFNTSLPLACVKHNHNPTEETKFGGERLQTQYNRKNWSSFVLWNCDHKDHRELTIGDVNTKPGSWLHAFSWLEEEIGSIPEEWNWLDGHSRENINPKNVHFTTGGPIWPHWVPTRNIDALHADEFKRFLETV